jgi:4-amino-4-deoxy-L-arabinose transferase-like glycosyltransferase
MPYDPISISLAAVSALLCWAAIALRRGLAWRVGLVLLAAFLLRADAAWQHSLYAWDERYHAVVAKHLAEDPLKPTLYQRPLLPYDPTNWHVNHVWLAHPTGALWLMAGSMRLFGVDELAMRAPSVLLSTASVLLTFLIGARTCGERVGLLAAAFHAFNGFLIELTGRRGGDHTDTALIFFVLLGVWAALQSAREPRLSMLGLAGVALGFGYLSKSFPALIVLPVAFAIFVERAAWPAALGRTALIALVGVAVAAPWTAYTWIAFPVEAAWTTRSLLIHTTETLEAHPGSTFGYVLGAMRFMGELVWLPVAAAIGASWRASWGSELRPLVIWILIPYVTFSLMATRLPQYVMIAAPPLFIVQAWFWWRLRERVRTMPSGRRRVAMVALLVFLAVLPAKYTLEPTGVLERRDRRPALFEELRELRARLQLPDAVIFNMPRPVEAMFYSPYVAYREMPTADQVRQIHAQGIPIVIYQPVGHRVSVPSDWPVVQLEGIRPVPP